MSPARYTNLTFKNKTDNNSAAPWPVYIQYQTTSTSQIYRPLRQYLMLAECHGQIQSGGRVKLPVLPVSCKRTLRPCLKSP